MSEEKSKPEKPADPVVKKLPEMEHFMFKESPYYQDQLAARAVKVAADAVINHNYGSSEVRDKIKNAVAEYVSKDLLGASVRQDIVTGNMLLKTMTDTVTGLTDERLSDLIEDGKPLTSQTWSAISNDVTRSYQRWSGNVFSTALRGAVKTKDGRKFLEERVNEWDNKFSLGVKRDQLVDNEKLLQAYFEGAQQNQQYLQKTTDGPLYVPPN